MYPKGDPDSNGWTFFLLSKDGDTLWTADNEVDPPCPNKWLECSKEELMDLLKKAVAEYDEI